MVLVAAVWQASQQVAVAVADEGVVPAVGSSLRLWEANSQYTTGEAVLYDGQWFVAMTNHNSGAAFSAENWKMMPLVVVNRPNHRQPKAENVHAKGRAELKGRNRQGSKR